MNEQASENNLRPTFLQTIFSREHLVNTIFALAFVIFFICGIVYFFSTRSRRTESLELTSEEFFAEESFPAVSGQQVNNVLDQFFLNRSPDGLYPADLTCDLLNGTCKAGDENHRLGYGMLWGLSQANQAFSHSDQKEANLYQLQTILAAYRDHYDSGQYIYQNDRYTCVLLAEVNQNGQLTSAERQTLQDICFVSENETYVPSLSETDPDYLRRTIEHKIVDLAEPDPRLAFDWADDPEYVNTVTAPVDEALKIKQWSYLAETATGYLWRQQTGDDLSDTLISALNDFNQLLSLYERYAYLLPSSPDLLYKSLLNLDLMTQIYQKQYWDTTNLVKLTQKTEDLIREVSNPAVILQNYDYTKLAETAFLSLKFKAISPEFNRAVKREVESRYGTTPPHNIGGWSEYISDTVDNPGRYSPSFDPYVNGLLGGYLVTPQRD